MAEYNSDRTGANIDATLDKVDVRETVIDINNNTTRRISVNDSGVVFIGKSVSNIALEGVELFPDNRAAFTRDGGYPLLLNRTGSDGKLLDFRKNGALVGSIGTYSGNAYYAGTTRGLRFEGTQALPCNENGLSRDADTNLGATDVRFKDLYLSGGVYLGGTGAANKLDDYEEGVWTPTLGGSITNPSITYTSQVGAYTVVGNVVHVQGRIQVSTASGGSGILALNLPFKAKNRSLENFVLNVARLQSAGIDLAGTDYAFMVLDNQSSAYLYYNTNTTGNHTTATVSTISSNFTFSFSGTYRID